MRWRGCSASSARVERLADLGKNGPLLASAGDVSLFHCLFGRDAIRMAFDLLDDFPAVAYGTLLELARLQGVAHDPRHLVGAGIRTKSTTAARFRPGAYHNGSTWPMDSGVIADGLRRWGYVDFAADLEERILRGCCFTGGFPEFLRGEPDGSIAVNTAVVDAVVDGVMNRLEQPPQANQGWTATRVWRILRRYG